MLMSFAIVLGQFSYIYNLGETGCYSTFMGYKVSHMEIDCKEQKAPKMTVLIPLVQLITL